MSIALVLAEIWPFESFANLAWNAYSRYKNFRFGGLLTPKHYFSSSRPPKGTSLAKTAHFEPLSDAIRPAVWPGQSAKNTKRVAQSGHQKNWVLALSPSLTIFGMWGGPLDVFLKFEFRVGRCPNFGATGGQTSPFSYSRHIAYAAACCYRTSCDGFCFRWWRASHRDLQEGLWPWTCSPWMSVFQFLFQSPCVQRHLLFNVIPYSETVCCHHMCSFKLIMY